MDLFDELEKMALNAASDLSDGLKALSKDTIFRWEKLFGYSHADAVGMIERHRGNLSRKRVSDEHWEIVREEREAQGYDREAYEHDLEIGGRSLKSTQAKVEGSRGDVRQREKYIVKLEEDLTVEVIQKVSRLKQALEIVKGSGEDGDARFCVVDWGTRQALLDHFSETRFRPTVVRITRPAEKAFSSDSRYPTLGLDTTLPQHRCSERGGPFRPAQDEYPVWYFFYGTLTDSTVLTRHLLLNEEPVLYHATVTGGLLENWGGKYRALVDGPENATVQGLAYQVMTREHEDALRTYETDKYEVVRCGIEIEGRWVQGCTFRFVEKIYG
jgi:hypothetical protein